MQKAASQMVQILRIVSHKLWPQDSGDLSADWMEVCYPVESRSQPVRRFFRSEDP